MRWRYAAFLMIPLLWVGLEYFRTELPIFGFGWGALGYSLTSNLLLVQIADLFGVYGVSAFVMAINVIVFYMLHSSMSFRKRTTKLKRFGGFTGYMIVLTALIIAVYYYGTEKARNINTAAKSVRIGLVQGNIPQQLKWVPEYKNDIIDKYAKLIEFVSYDGPELVVIPEASYPGDFTAEYPSSVWKQAVANLGAEVLIGALRFRSFEEQYNSAFLVSPEEEVQAYYDKIKLVPFGEYIPLESFFSGIGISKLAYSLGVGNFSKGDKYKVFKSSFSNVGELGYSVLICFEDVFPSFARRFRREGAQFLFVMTNDAWFGDTSAPYQHLQASVFRAIESGCYLMRAANTGITAFISPLGRVEESVKDAHGKKTFITGGITYDVPVYSYDTFFLKGGVYFAPVAFLFFLAYMSIIAILEYKSFCVK